MNNEMQAALEVAEEGMAVPVDAEREHFLQEYDLPEAKIAELSAKYLPLKIIDLSDRQGYNAVHEARMEVRDYRIAVEKTRKRLKEESLEYGRRVDKEARRLTALLDPIESHLEAEEKRIDDEKARVKAEEQRQREAMLQSRVDRLTAVGGMAGITLAELVLMSEAVYEVHLKAATDTWKAKEDLRLKQEAEAKRLAELEAQEKARQEAEAQAAREAEAKRQAEIRAEQEAEARRLAAAAAELKARQDEIERKEREAARLENERRIREEAEAKARADAEAAARREQERKEQAAREEKVRQEEEARRVAAALAAKPDADKLLTFADEVDAMTFPNMATDAGRLALQDIKSLQAKLVTYIRTRAQALTK